YVLMSGFVLGAVASAMASIIGRKRGLAKPSLRDMVVVWIPVVAELLVFLLVYPRLPDDMHLRMVVTIAIVGLHFLPMAWSFGPLIFWLGLACMAVAACGQFVPAIPLPALIATDGALKLAFGLAMFAGLFRPQLSVSPAS